MQPSRVAAFAIHFQLCRFQNMAEIHPGVAVTRFRNETVSRATHAIKIFNLDLLHDLLSGP
jgi:hypothetical protein